MLTIKTTLVTLAICLTAIGIKTPVKYNKNTDLYRIHSSVIKTLKAKKYTASKETNKVYLSFFDFTQNSNLSDNKEDILYRPDWLNFIKGIDTTKILNYRLSSAGDLWFKPRKSGYGSIIFAPVIISVDRKKALCIFHKFRTGSTGSYMVAYMQLTNNRWIVEKFDTLAYLD